MAEPLVVDASAWAAVLLKEEGSDLIQAHMNHSPLTAPELVRYEVANTLLQAHRRGRLPVHEESLSRLLDSLQEFSIQEAPLSVWWKQAVRLAQRHKLSFYDSSYLATALALGIPLLTLDEDVRKAARHERLLCL